MTKITLNIIKDLIAEGKIEEAIEKHLLPNTSSSLYSDEIIALLARWNNLEKESVRGTIDFEQFSKEKNKITNSLLILLSNLNQKNVTFGINPSYKPQFNRNQLEQLTESLKGSIVFYALFSVFIFILGLIIMAIGLSFEEKLLATATNIGGGLISTLSGLPVKEIISRRERIGVFKVIMLKMERIAMGNLNTQDARKIDSLVWQIIEKKVLS